MHTVHNARITLLATAVNNLALAAIVAPVIGSQLQGGGRALVAFAWIGFGIVLHGCGQLVLGRLRQ